MGTGGHGLGRTQGLEESQSWAIMGGDVELAQDLVLHVLQKTNNKSFKKRYCCFFQNAEKSFRKIKTVVFPLA